MMNVFTQKRTRKTCLCGNVQCRTIFEYYEQSSFEQHKAQWLWFPKKPKLTTRGNIRLYENKLHRFEGFLRHLGVSADDGNNNNHITTYTYMN